MTNRLALPYTQNMPRRDLLLWLCFVSTFTPSAAPPVTTTDFNQLACFLGRDYFVIRSGRAQMILQADQAELGPAFTYLLYAIQDARQSARKDGALNWVTNIGAPHTATTVVLERNQVEGRAGRLLHPSSCTLNDLA